MNDFLIASEAAVILNCTAANVRAIERTGKLHAIRTATGVRLFRRKDVERLVAEREQQKQKKAARAANDRPE